MTMTGNVYRPGAVEPQQDLFQAVWASLGGNAPQALQDVPDAPETAPDEDIRHGASAAANGDKFDKLWLGNWQGDYPSQSEADFVLVDIIAFYTQNRAQIARMFVA
jgi:primase-polymerase (primpol)-like protein